jgi:cell division protein FtsA
VALVDLGAGTTSIAVYEENNLLHTAIIPVGSMHITNDIAIGLRCTIDTAEKVKLVYGQASPSMVDKLAEIDMSKIDPEEDTRISQKLVAEIIEARLEEIFDYVTRELKRIDRDGKLPAGIVLTGGGAALPGVVDFAKHYLRLPVSVGVPSETDTIIDQVVDPSFATVVGLSLWGSNFSGTLSDFSLTRPLKGLLENQNVVKLKKWFKAILP